MAIFNPRVHPRHQPILIGHQEAFTQLSQAFKRDEIPSTWLITGEYGVGKSTLAYQFAKEILGRENSTITKRQIEAGCYPNLLVIEPKDSSWGGFREEMTVGSIVPIFSFLQHSPALSGWRMVIIDGANQLNHYAANALLKVLETPPLQTLIVLIAHTVGKILPTLRSRCCQLVLQPLKEEEMEQVLPDIDNRSLLIQLARGSIGRALQLYRAGSSMLLEEILCVLIQASRGNFRSAYPFAEKVAKKDDLTLRATLEILQWWLYRLVVASYAPLMVEPLLVNEAETMRQLLAVKPVAHWIEAWLVLHRFLLEAIQSHLDPLHLIMGAFFIVEKPCSMSGSPYLHA